MSENLKVVRGGGGAPIPPDEDLWTVERVAQFLGLSKDTVYRLAEKGKIPYRRICARLRFIPSEVREWASRGMV